MDVFVEDSAEVAHLQPWAGAGAQEELAAVTARPAQEWAGKIREGVNQSKTFISKLQFKVQYSTILNSITYNTRYKYNLSSDLYNHRG